MRRFLLLLPIAALLAGCPAPDGLQPPTCTVEDELPPGELHAQVDGDEWVAEVPPTAMTMGAGGMMLFFNVDANNSLTMRLRASSLFSVEGEDEEAELVIDEGEDIEDIHGGRATPADFSVGDGTDDGADATLVVDDLTLHTGHADVTGFLRLVEYAEDEDTGAVTLLGCGWFDAAEQNGDGEASMTGISFATPIQ